MPPPPPPPPPHVWSIFHWNSMTWFWWLIKKLKFEKKKNMYSYQLGYKNHIIITRELNGFLNWYAFALDLRCMKLISDSKFSNPSLITPVLVSDVQCRKTWNAPTSHELCNRLPFSFVYLLISWGRHDMESLSALLALRGGIHRCPHVTEDQQCEVFTSLGCKSEQAVEYTSRLSDNLRHKTRLTVTPL